MNVARRGEQGDRVGAGRRGAALRAAVVLGVGVLSMGPTCGGPSDTTTIEIKTPAGDYKRTVGNDQTAAWDKPKLEPAGSSGTGPATVWLRGREPRELFVFDNWVSEDLSPGAPPPWWPVPQPESFIRYASVPTAPIDMTISRTLRMPVKSARLIDHGGCFSPTDLTSSSDMFKTINAGILTELQKAADAEGASVK